MHISEGILAGTSQGQVLLVAGGVSAAVGTVIGLRRMDQERIPQVALLSAAFFVASLVHVPLGPTVEHLVLSGLLGLVLGWAAFPAVLVALALQAVFFSYGGLTTLGVNTVVMALPGVACHYLFRGAARRGGEGVVFAAGFAAGAVAILMGGLLQAGALAAAGESFQLLGRIVFVLHLPVAAVEGLVTGSIVVFLRQVRPELLQADVLLPAKSEFCDG